MFSNQLFHHKMVNYWLDNFDKGHVFCILDYPGSYRLWLTYQVKGSKRGGGSDGFKSWIPIVWQKINDVMYSLSIYLSYLLVFNLNNLIKNQVYNEWFAKQLGIYTVWVNYRTHFFEFKFFTWIKNLKEPNLLFTFTKLYVQTKLKYEVASQDLINYIVPSFLFFYSSSLIKFPSVHDSQRLLP